jgi:phosphoglucosamine mutase
VDPAARIFGTDGIRGLAGEGWLSADNVARLGRAAGRVLGARISTRRALLGHDGRASGPELERALARGLAEGDFHVESAGLITTPGLASMTRAWGFGLGAMLSASHNPAEDNGVKLFTAAGRKLSDDDELAIERALRAEHPVGAGASGLHVAAWVEHRYVDALVERAGRGLALAGLHVVVDCANGGGSRIAPRAFERLGARCTAIYASPDGANINRDCGSTHPASLQAEVVRQGAHLGVALDGDGDRCMLVDERGAIVDGDAQLCVLGRHFGPRWADRRVVATVMSNKGLHRALREVGVGVVLVGVGDRYVVEALERESLSLGGEQSGHIVFGADNDFIGDGVYTALRVLRVMRETGQPLGQLAAAYRVFPQVLINVKVARKPVLTDLAPVRSAVQRIEAELGDDGRVLLRYSGTEPLARVMIEGPVEERVRRYADELARLIAAEIGA